MKKFKSKLVLLCDSREQRPLDFKDGVFDEIKTEGLGFADYHCQFVYGESVIDQMSIPIVFERKGLSDLFGTLTKGMDRFKRMLERAASCKAEVVLLIEGSMRDVANGTEHSSVDGNQILKTVFSLWVRHGVLPIFCPDRRQMARFIEETYTAVARNYSKDIDAKHK